MIVTPQGLNVFPEDVERALLAQPGVKDAGVVGLQRRRRGAHSRGARARARRGRATRSSAARTRRSKITSACGARRSGRATALPRTEGTQKLKRREIQRWAAGEARRRAGAPAARHDRRGRRRALRRRPRASRRRRRSTSWAELARSRRADDGARRSVPDDARRERAGGRQDDWRTSKRWSASGSGSGLRAFARCARGGDPSSKFEARRRSSTAADPIAFPSWNRSAASPGSSAASACRRGFFRSGASS